jgi:hypothetical protein
MAARSVPKARVRGLVSLPGFGGRPDVGEASVSAPQPPP